MPSDTLPSVFPNFIPLRLADQAADALRKAIHRGVWVHYLPGEHELAHLLGISRPTLHTALVPLVKEGLIVTSHGRRTRILPNVSPSNINRTVCVVAPASFDTVGLAGNPLLFTLRTQLAARGIGWEELFSAKLNGRNPGYSLKKLVSERRRVCWLIVAETANIQRWFENAGVPTLVLGSCHPGIHLSSVDLDHHAVGWHAAGSMTRLGHRHIALVLRDNPLPGELACRDGIAHYLGQTDGQNSLTLVAAGPKLLDLKSKLERLLAHRPRPTVIFAMNPEQTLTVLMHLLQCGLHIPNDISVVSGNTHALFETSTPELTRYCGDSEKMARHAVRALQSLLVGHPVSLKPFLVTPTFVRGTTLARPSVLV